MITTPFNQIQSFLFITDNGYQENNTGYKEDNNGYKENSKHVININVVLIYHQLSNQS